MAKIYLTEAQLINLVKEDISAIRKDKKKEIFDYHSLTNGVWDDLVHDAQKLQRINFDLENNDTTGQKKTLYVKKDLRKDQPVKYEFNAELMEAGGDWEMPVMYFRLEITHDYFYGKLKKSGEQKYTFNLDDPNYEKKLSKCYVIIPPVEAGNKLVKYDDNAKDKYDWMAYQDSSPPKEIEKDLQITDGDKQSVWKWLEELLNQLVEDNHEMLNEDRTIVTTDDAKKLESFSEGYIGIVSPHQIENNELNNKASDTCLLYTSPSPRD